MNNRILNSDLIKREIKNNINSHVLYEKILSIKKKTKHSQRLTHVMVNFMCHLFLSSSHVNGIFRSVRFFFLVRILD